MLLASKKGVKIRSVTVVRVSLTSIEKLRQLTIRQKMVPHGSVGGVGGVMMVGVDNLIVYN